VVLQLKCVNLFRDISLRLHNANDWELPQWHKQAVQEFQVPFCMPLHPFLFLSGNVEIFKEILKNF
jgi:hypothetical protein